MFDLTNKQLITGPIIPEKISDAKDIVLAEIQIPGLNFAPVFFGSNRNRKVSFTLKMLKRNNTVGNLLMLSQMDNLRNGAAGPFSLATAGQFTRNPKVLYSWGIGSVPLEFFVSRISFEHDGLFVNALGFPQLTEVTVELTLDETSPVYRMEESFRRVNAIAGGVLGLADVIQSQITDRTVY